jgi:hypothetical protein
MNSAEEPGCISACSLEDLGAGTQLDKVAPVLEQLETIAHELVKQIDGITVEGLRRQAEGMTPTFLES